MASRILPVIRQVGVVLGYLLVYVLIWAGLAMLIAAIGIRYYFGKISFGQMRLNIVTVETDGGGGPLVWMGILGIGVLPLVITIGIAVWHFFRRRKRRRLGCDTRPQGKKWAMRGISTALVTAVAAGGTTAFASTVGIGDYIRSANSPYNIGDYYEEPTVTSAENKRNLVTIYLESGEQTLANDEHFEKDAFAPLKDVTRAEDGWQSIEDFNQYEGGGWTMSGLVSTQCGVPLKGVGASVDSGSPDQLVGDTKSYLGGLTCLGDILAEEGYTNVFLGGANPSFAAKGTFLANHGYTKDLGLDDWRAAGEPESSFRSDWGLSDERLMANAKNEIDELYAASQQTGQPFNLSMLTLDTHEPVHIYDYCTVDTDSEVTSAFFCSMTQVADFVEYMNQMGYLEDTSVVIMGDHLKHMSAGDAFHEQLGGHTNRTIFNRIWVPGETGTTEMRSGADQLNMFPTLLEAAGFTLEKREAGLGVSAFTSKIPGDSAQSFEPDPYRDLLDSRSEDFYSEAWSSPAGR